MENDSLIEVPRKKDREKYIYNKKKKHAQKEFEI